MRDASWIESIGSDLLYAGFWGWPIVEQEAVYAHCWAWWCWLTRKPPPWLPVRRLARNPSPWPPIPWRTTCDPALRRFIAIGFDGTIFLNLWRSAVDEQRLETLVAFVLSNAELLRAGRDRLVHLSEHFPDKARFDLPVRDWLLDPRTLDTLRFAAREQVDRSDDTAQRLGGAIALLAAAEPDY